MVRYEWAVERATGVVLDAACGIGYGTAMLAAAEDVRHAHGIEVNEDVVTLARHYYGNRHGPGAGCTFASEELHTWVHEEADCDLWFDTVVSFETIEHLVRPELFLCEVWGSMKPKAKLYFSTPNAEVEPHRLEDNPFHLRHYTEKEATELATWCGFSVDCVWKQIGGIRDSRIVHDSGPPGRFWVIECTRNDSPGDAHMWMESRHRTLARAMHEAFIERCRIIRSLRQ